MDASRSAGSAEPTQYVPGRPPVVEGTADSNAIVRGPVPAAAAAGTAAAASAGQKEQQAQHADEDDDAHALAELLGWEEQHQELQLQAAATASASAAARRRQLQELWEGDGRGRKQQRRRAARACAADLKPLPPAVSCAEVMAALEGVEGVRRRSIVSAWLPGLSLQCGILVLTRLFLIFKTRVLGANVQCPPLHLPILPAYLSAYLTNYLTA